MGSSAINMIQDLVVSKIENLFLGKIPVFIEGQKDPSLNMDINFVMGTHSLVINVGSPIPSEYAYLPQNIVTFRRAILPVKVMHNKDWILEKGQYHAHEVAEKIIIHLAQIETKLPQGYIIITPSEHNVWKVAPLRKEDNIAVIELQLNAYFFAEIINEEVL